MATPIKETPILRGRDARRFMKAIANPQKVSRQEIERMRESAKMFKSSEFELGAR